MNSTGAILMDGKPSGGFVMDVTKPAAVTVHGNYDKGFFVKFADTPMEMGPYHDPAIAWLVAQRWDGVLERAN